ncbi:MAG: inner membrane CreD family protein, partial [Tenacibaculum sp.]
MEQQPNKFVTWIKTSYTARMLMIGFLSILLIIPLVFIEDLIFERSRRQQSVVNEISKQWGNEVVIYGPILKVPYKEFTEKTITDQKTKKVTSELIEEIKYAFQVGILTYDDAKMLISLINRLINRLERMLRAGSKTFD